MDLDRAGAPPGRAPGFTDWLPPTAARRQRVLSGLLAEFEQWGYEQLSTPLLEPLDTVAMGLGAVAQHHLFRFMDSDGSLLALVGERTVSVARVVATQLRGAELPLRLCYAGPVLQNQPLHGGRRRETMQAGCELIGSRDVAADAECVALATEALDAVGLRQVQVDVGHAGFLPGLLADAGLEPAQQRRVLEALGQRDLVAVEAALEGSAVGDVERDLLLRFPALRGGPELLDVAARDLRSPRARAALDELASLWRILDAHGIAATAHIDLGAVRDWDYYTGPIFELFTGDLGFPLGTGGRYDHLLDRFGFDVAAVGFVLHADRCVDAVLREGHPGHPVLQVAFAHGALEHGVEAARRLRAAGLRTATSPQATREFPAAASLFIAGDAVASWRDGEEERRGSVDEAVAALLARSLSGARG